METRYLRSFIKIAETSSISRAADSLGVSQPSLSQQILRLEDEVGVPLFSRTARGVTLTEAGKHFLLHARQILEGVNRAVEDARQFGKAVVGEVILAAPYSLSRLAGADLFKTMALRAPQVRFRLVEAMTAQTWGWIEEAKVDLGLLNYLGPRRDLTFRQIASEELFLVGPPGKFGSIEALPDCGFADLAGLSMILPGLPHSLRQLIEAEVARHGGELKLFRELDALVHIPQLIRERYGYSILPLSAIAPALAAGEVSIARIEGGAIRRKLALARNSNAAVTHASLVCEAAVIEVLNGLIDDGRWIAASHSAGGGGGGGMTEQ